MITYTDDSQIERKTKVAKYASNGGLGNPTAKAEAQVGKLQSWLKPKGEGADAPIAPLIVFTKPDVELQVPERYEHILLLKSLKGYLQRHTTPALPGPLYRALADAVTPPAGEAVAVESNDAAEAAAEPVVKPTSRRKEKRRKKSRQN